MEKEMKTKKVTCPETTAKQFVQIEEDGGIHWCSRWAGSPVCAQTCVPVQMRSKRFQAPQPPAPAAATEEC